MKCPKCKKLLRRGTEFCPSCGARIEKKRGIRFLPILLVLLLLLSTVVLGWSGSILFAKYFHINFKGLFSGKETIEIHNVEEAIEHARELGEEYGYDNAMSELTESDAYQAYALAVKKTTESGNWSENLSMTANMAITDGNAKTKTKVTLTSDADVSNYSESNLSQIHISGSAEMTAMGQTYAWEMEYENGTAHYRYTKPDKTSADMKIDPSFFNFEILTSITNIK